MSEFILNRNFNGSFKGETVTVPNHLDGEMIRNRIGQKVEKKAVEVAPKNKAILSVPKNKKAKNVRHK